MSSVRDCVKLAKETEVNHYYCMTIKDSDKLFEAYRDDLWSLIWQSFKFGYAQGVKAESAAEKRRREEDER